MSTVATKAKGIIFSAPMVRAILAGRKTQTRRVLRKQPFMSEHHAGRWLIPEGRSTYATNERRTDTFKKDGVFVSSEERQMPVAEWLMEKSPYAPGDLLYVKETWSPDHQLFYPHFPVVYRADSPIADSEIEDGHVASPEANGQRFPFRWRSSLFLPRHLSRLTLEITDVRVQRVQEITEADAEAEGCIRPVIGCALDEFFKLWEQIHGEGAWQRNDWTWAIGFKVAK